MRSTLLTITILLIFRIISYTQIFQYTQPIIYFSPTISIGYTFRSGWNFGFELTIGYKKIAPTIPEMYSGLNIQYYLIYYHGDLHKIFDFNFIIDSQMAKFGIGIGRISKTWGYKKVNRDAAIGYSVIFNLSSNNLKYPFLGVKAFVPSPKWTWSSLPYYLSYYLFWQKEPFVVH